MVARFAPQKNQTMLLEAAARLCQPFHLVLVGAGPLRARAWARACGVLKNARPPIAARPFIG
jgi:glycosyltransferase involved in cell wall biosynthesis